MSRFLSVAYQVDGRVCRMTTDPYRRIVEVAAGGLPAELSEAGSQALAIGTLVVQCETVLMFAYVRCRALTDCSQGQNPARSSSRLGTGQTRFTNGRAAGGNVASARDRPAGP